MLSLLQKSIKTNKTTMKIYKKTPHLLRIIGVLTLVAAVSIQSLLQTTAYAGQITVRSLTLQANGLNGGSKPGAVVNHLFTFTVPTAGSVGSVRFEYCTKAADVGSETCQSPTSMDASTATLTSGTGIDGMSVGTANSNMVLLVRSNTNNVAANTVATFQLSNVTNPQALKADNITPEPNYTFYVRISTYASQDGTGTAVDRGTVTASTAEPIVITGTMPESLVFCTGATVPFFVDISGGLPGITTTIPNCADATPGQILFDKLFSPTATATATSQMAASTNASEGYVITVNGATLMSGVNAISSLATESYPIPGVSQFGLNLKANDDTYFDAPVGTEVSPLPSDSVIGGVTYRGQAATGYDLLNRFRFATGETVANSYNGYTPGAPGATAATDGQIYTVAYIANVPGSQPAGDYSTTLTYICTPTF